MYGEHGDFTQFLMKSVPLGWGIRPQILSNPHLIPSQGYHLKGDLITRFALMVGYYSLV